MSTKKIGRKLVMLYKKAKNAEGKEVARNLFRHPLGDFRHPLKISLPPPGRNPETATGISTGVYAGNVHCSKVSTNGGFIRRHEYS